MPNLPLLFRNWPEESEFLMKGLIKVFECELVPLPKIAGSLGDDGLRELRVPKCVIGPQYSVLAEARPAGSGELIIFGEKTHLIEFAYNPTSGSVIMLAGKMQHQSVVNTSLERFLECVVLVNERYPFYKTSDDLNAGRIGDEIQAQIYKIDPQAIEGGGYWVDFCDEVRMGDWAEDV